MARSLLDLETRRQNYFDLVNDPEALRLGPSPPPRYQSEPVFPSDPSAPRGVAVASNDDEWIPLESVVPKSENEWIPLDEIMASPVPIPKPRPKPVSEKMPSFLQDVKYVATGQGPNATWVAKALRGAVESPSHWGSEAKRLGTPQWGLGQATAPADVGERGAGLMNLALEMNAPVSPAHGTEAALYRTMRPGGGPEVFLTPEYIMKSKLERLGMKVPWSSLGESGRTLGEAISHIPIARGPLVKASERAASELKSAGDIAAKRALSPTGENPLGWDVPVGVAGSRLIKHATDSLTSGKTFNSKVSGAFIRLRGASNEEAIDLITNWAREKGGDAAKLRGVWSSLPAADKAVVRSRIVRDLGYDSAEGGFNPTNFINNYSKLSDTGKVTLFRENAGLKQYLDDLYDVSKMMQNWKGFESKPAFGTRLGSASMFTALTGVAVGASVAGPLGALAPLVAAKGLSNLLAKPATAAAVSRWSKAYYNLFSNGKPSLAVAWNAYQRATGELSKTTGIELDPVALARSGVEVGAENALKSARTGVKGYQKLKQLVTEEPSAP